MKKKFTYVCAGKKIDNFRYRKRINDKFSKQSVDLKIFHGINTNVYGEVNNSVIQRFKDRG